MNVNKKIDYFLSSLTSQFFGWTLKLWPVRVKAHEITDFLIFLNVFVSVNLNLLPQQSRESLSSETLLFPSITQCHPSSHYPSTPSLLSFSYLLRRLFNLNFSSIGFTINPRKLISRRRDQIQKRPVVTDQFGGRLWNKKMNYICKEVNFRWEL